MDQSKKYLKYALVILAVVFILLAVFLFREYRVLRHSQIRASWFASLNHKHIPLGINDVSAIRPWMTFDYINRLFNLPSDYLKTALKITDSRYPRITISNYPITQVENAITFFLTPK